jgi:hypothetical protein
VKIGSYIYNVECMSGCSFFIHLDTVVRIPTNFGMIVEDPPAQVSHGTQPKIL